MGIMNDKRRKADNSLEHLTERLVDTIIAATDSELVADAKEDGVDLAAKAAHGRHLLTQALAAGGKRKLAAARAAPFPAQPPRQNGAAAMTRTCPHCAYRFLRHLAYCPKCGGKADG